MVLTASLPVALQEAQTFARKESEGGFAEWYSFLVSAPRPAIHGIWRLMSPGIQVMVMEAFPFLHKSLRVPIARPTGIRVLKGTCDTGIGMEPDSSEVTAVISAGDTSMLGVPGMSYRINPVEDSCVFLVVRLAPFPRLVASEPRLIQALSAEHVLALKRQAARLLAS